MKFLNPVNCSITSHLCDGKTRKAIYTIYSLIKAELVVYIRSLLFLHCVLSQNVGFFLVFLFIFLDQHIPVCNDH